MPKRIAANVKKMLGLMAQTDYDSVYARIKSRSYFPEIAIEYPDYWTKMCTEDLERAKGRAPEAYPVKEQPVLDLETLRTKARKRRAPAKKPTAVMS